MWNYLKKVYHQNNVARRFQLEHDITLFKQDSLSISDYYSQFMNLWAEYTDIVYADLIPGGLRFVQFVHETTKRGHFLMKLRSEFEGIRSNLMHRNPVPSLDACFNDLLREEQRLLAQSSFEDQKLSTVPVAYVARGKSRSHDTSAVQCFCCKQLGHYASNCPNIFCNYCKKDGHILKECSIRPPKRNVRAFTASIDSSIPNNLANPTPIQQNTYTTTSTVTPKMVQQMIVSAFSALGFSGPTIREDNCEGA